MKQRIAILVCLVACSSISAQPRVGGCQSFPSNNIWNTPIHTMPVHARSSQYVATVGADLSLRNDFGSGLWNGAPIGIPYVVVGISTPKKSVVFDYTDESDNVEYPIPDNPPIEGGDASSGDRHVLIVDSSTCTLYELYHVVKQNSAWTAGSGAVFDLSSNALRPDTWTSADAAGLPILPGLVRYDEVASGAIHHMIRFTVPKTSRAYLWPARHYASSITDPAYPPMGLVMRLKNTFDTSALQPQARIIAKALMTYGMILADNGSAWYMSGVPDERWDMDDLYTLRQIHGRDFEAVDISSLMADRNSGVVKSNTSVVEQSKEKRTFVVTAGRVEIAAASPLPSSVAHWVAIYDVLGSEIRADEVTITTNEQRVSLDTSRLQTGTYYLIIGAECFMLVVF